MVRSRNWPDLWWQISNIRDIQVVGIYDLMKRWRFETNRISSVATAQPQSQKPVFDFDLTWWPDLWWPRVDIFTQGVKFNCEQVLKKWRRCAPPFFPLFAKNRRGGHFLPPPPVRVLKYINLSTIQITFTSHSSWSRRQNRKRYFLHVPFWPNIPCVFRSVYWPVWLWPRPAILPRTDTMLRNM